MRKYRKLLSIVLALIIIACTASAQACAADGANPFDDVSEAEWEAGAIHYVYEKGLMVGTGNKKFSPSISATKGMLATVIYRLDGKPPIKDINRFSDISGNSWYSDAAAWTEQLAITEINKDGAFEPDTQLDFSQVAVMLCRYAKFKEYNTDSNMSISAYLEYDSITPEAEKALSWIISSNIWEVKSGRTNPDEIVSRSELAEIIYNYCMFCLTDSNNEQPIDFTPDGNVGNNDYTTPPDGGETPPADDDKEVGAESEENNSRTARFMVSNVQTTRGAGNVSVKISVLNNPGISSIGMKVEFDRSLELTSVLFNDEIPGERIKSQSNTSPIKIVWVSPFEDISDDFTFAVLDFNIKESLAQGKYDIKISYDPDDVYNLAEENVAFEIQNGSITIS